MSSKQRLAVLFLDVKGYSSLKEHQFKKYEEVLKRINAYLLDACYKNSWGDGVVAAFNNALEAAIAATDITRTLSTNIFSIKTDAELPSEFSVRIALHFGEVFRIYDPIMEKDSLAGRNVITAARIEPFVSAGEIWTTEEFMIEMKNSTGYLFEEIQYKNFSYRLSDKQKAFFNNQPFQLYKLIEDNKSGQMVLPLNTTRIKKNCYFQVVSYATSSWPREITTREPSQVNFWHLNNLRIPAPKKDDFVGLYTTTNRDNKSLSNVQMVMHGWVIQHRDLTIDEIWTEHQNLKIDCGVDDEDEFRFGVIEACRKARRSESDLHDIQTGKLTIPCTTISIQEYMTPQISLADYFKREGIAIQENDITLKYSLSGPFKLDFNK